MTPQTTSTRASASTKTVAGFDVDTSGTTVVLSRSMQELSNKARKEVVKALKELYHEVEFSLDSSKQLLIARTPIPCKIGDELTREVYEARSELILRVASQMNATQRQTLQERDKKIKSPRSSRPSRRKMRPIYQGNTGDLRYR